MHIKTTKRILWVLNTVLVLAIVLVALKFFILDGQKNRQPRAAEDILGKQNLPSARPDKDRKRREILPPESYRVTYELVIDGDLPIEIKVDNTAMPTVELEPLQRDYELRWTKVDPQLMGSMAHLVKKNDPEPRKVLYVRPGDKVAGGWKLVLVRPGKADFVEESTGQRVSLEQVETAPPELRPVDEGENPGLPPGFGGELPPQPKEAPTREAVQVRENAWQGTREETRWWSEHGEAELESVAVQPYKNPATGEPEGVELKSVRTGSMVQKRGLLAGDIIKSINGHPVTSRSEAIAWVKGPGKGLATYTAVIQRKGRLITMTYNVPGR